MPDMPDSESLRALQALLSEYDKANDETLEALKAGDMAKYEKLAQAKMKAIGELGPEALRNVMREHPEFRPQGYDPDSEDQNA